MIKYNKIFLYLNIITFYLILSFKCFASDLNINNKFIAIGPDEALVKIKIFSSLTCPHCASFHLKVIPKIKSEYMDSGKLQLIFIDFPLDQAAFNASKLLQCADNNKKMNFMDIIYENQSQWANSTDIETINKNLKKIVKDLGISSDRFDKCLIDEAISDKILNGRIDAHQKYSINSTPTIVINEKKLEGSVNFKNIKKKIDKII